MPPKDYKQLEIKYIWVKIVISEHNKEIRKLKYKERMNNIYLIDNVIIKEKEKTNRNKT